MRKRRTGASSAPDSRTYDPGRRRTVALVIVLLLSAVTLFGGDKEKKKPQRPDTPYGVVAGTVFRADGIALPGADVVLAAEADSKDARKFNKMKYITDARGEFAIRVPPVPMKYVVTASAHGFVTRQKPVSISGEERVDVFFQLEPASK